MKIHLIKILGAVLFAGTLLAGCSDDPEASDYDTYSAWVSGIADFSSYETFGFVDVPPEYLEDAPSHVINNNAILRDGIRAEMLALGLTESSDTPDVVVSSLAFAETEGGWVYECIPGYVWWGWYPVWSSCAWYDQYYVEVDLGTIIIPVADTATEDVVMVGTLQGIVDSSSDSQQRIEDGLEAIFAEWPQ